MEKIAPEWQEFTLCRPGQISLLYHIKLGLETILVCTIVRSRVMQKT